MLRQGLAIILLRTLLETSPWGTRLPTVERRLATMWASIQDLSRCSRHRTTTSVQANCRRSTSGISKHISITTANLIPSVLLRCVR